MMKIQCPLLIISLITSFQLFGQIKIHSIGTLRQTGGDVGYTLDGMRMISQRSKLLDPANFGAVGTYGKEVVITDDYVTSGSLQNLSNVGEKDIFFIGSFSTLEPSLQQFTAGEAEALYQWSKNGGKMLIATGGKYTTLYDATFFSNYWGYSYISKVPSNLLPTAVGQSTLIFDGPFGTVSSATQGASAQGYFASIPADAKILALDVSGNPTMVLDCKTMDVLVADVDVYTDLNTSSPGSGVINEQDRIWVNSIAFMDKLQGKPVIVASNGQAVTTDSYVSYEWYVNDSLYSTNPSIPLPDCAYYRVSVETFGGCKFSTGNVYLEPERPQIIQDSDSISLNYSGEISQITWYKNDVAVSNSSTINFNDCASYYAIIETPEGCSYYSDTINSLKISFPDSFSPNGDALNDLIYPKTYDCQLASFSLSIFNRWGEEIFVTNDPSKSWDGRSQEKDLNEGVYFWKMRWTSTAQETFEEDGFFHLFR